VTRRRILTHNGSNYAESRKDSQQDLVTFMVSKFQKTVKTEHEYAI